MDLYLETPLELWTLPWFAMQLSFRLVLFRAVGIPIARRFGAKTASRLGLNEPITGDDLFSRCLLGWG